MYDRICSPSQGTLFSSLSPSSPFPSSLFPSLFLLSSFSLSFFPYSSCLFSRCGASEIMHSIGRLVQLSRARRVSDRKFVKLYDQFGSVDEADFLDLVKDADNEHYVVLIATKSIDIFWHCMIKLLEKQQIRLLKKISMKLQDIKDVEGFFNRFVEYSEKLTINEEMIDQIILLWNQFISKNPQYKQNEKFRVFIPKYLTFLSNNNFNNQFEYCKSKYLNHDNEKQFQPKLNNLKINVHSKHFNNLETIKIFYFFNEIFRYYQLPSNEKLHRTFNHNFNGDCEKFIRSIIMGIQLAEKTGQPKYIKNNWMLFLKSRLVKIILLYKCENLEDTVSQVFESFDDSSEHVKQNLVKSLIFNKMLSIKSYHKLFPNDGKVSQQNLIHEMSITNSVDKFSDVLNDKLYNISCEFISLDESNLIDIFASSLAKLEFSSAIQLEFVAAVESFIDIFINESDWEKLNRLLLVILSQERILESFLFNLSSIKVLVKLTKLIDQGTFKLDSDNDSSFQELFTYFGGVLLFIIVVTSRLHLDVNFRLKNSYVSNYLNNVKLNYGNLSSYYDDSVESNQIIVNNYNDLVNNWINSLFDESEGLSDDLIKSIDIKQIYQLIPIIYQQAIVAFVQGKINLKILLNGLDYLSQLYLLPCILSIIGWLVNKINLRNNNMNNYITVLNEIIKLTENLTKESSNEARVSAAIVLDRLAEKVASELKPNINNAIIIEKKKSLDHFKVDTNIGFDKFEANLIKVFNGYDADYKLIDTYINSHDLLLKNLLILVNSSNLSSSNENLKLVINFLIFVNLNKSIKTPDIKEYWINKLTKPAVKEATKKGEGFQQSIDYHYSSIFNIGDEDTEGDLFNVTTLDGCVTEFKKFNPDLIELFQLLLAESSNELGKIIKLIHTKLLADLRALE